MISDTLATSIMVISFIWYLVGTFTYGQWVANQKRIKQYSENAWRAYAAKHIHSLSGKLRAPMYFMFVYKGIITGLTDVDDDTYGIIPMTLAAGFSILGGLSLILIILICSAPAIPITIILGLAAIYGVFYLGKRV